MGLDSAIDQAVRPLTDALSGVVFYKVSVFDAEVPLVVAWLIAGGLIFTIYLRFISVRGFTHAIRIVRGDYSDARAPGEVSHFQALCTAVSGTVGIGNIGGVAIAISLGGPGATFWMIVAGLIGMTTKLAECTLAVLYRHEHADGSVSGGPMYYLQHGISEGYSKRAGRAIGSFYALGIVIGCLGIGNMFQSNQAYVQFVEVTGGMEGSWFVDKGALFGLVVACIVAAVIVGGIKSIARVTEVVVPFMAVLYVVGALVTIALNYEVVPMAIEAIVVGAFRPDGVSGGMVGVMVLGFQRAVFSNEAGIGSAAIAHSAVRTKEPVTEGYVALLEPFIDTVVICTMTALVIVITGVLNLDAETGMYVWNAELGRIATEGDVTGVELTSAAYAQSFSWFPAMLAIAVVLFAFSTMISWSYYGLKAWTYLFGEGAMKENVFKVIFCLFIVIGAAANLGPVIDFSDAMLFSMAVVNVIALYLLMPIVKKELGSYVARLRTGEIKKFK